MLSVSACSNTPVQGGGGFSMRSALMPEDEQIAVTADRVDEDFVNTMGLQIIAGRNFTSQDIKDASNDDYQKNFYHFILNESAAKQLGWTAQEAIGKKMFLGNERPGIVAGVVKDFHFESLHTPIKPFVLFPETWKRQLLVKVSGAHLQQTISSLESKWKTLVPYRPFEFHFLDEDYNKLYSSEIRLGTIMDLFAGIAIVLACLGLFGLSAYTVQQRFKEIGIRKVLGGSVSNIVITLSRILFYLPVSQFSSPFRQHGGHQQNGCRIFLSNFSYMECFCDSSVSNNSACDHYSKLPGNKSSDRKPGEIVTNRVTETIVWI